MRTRLVALILSSIVLLGTVGVGTAEAHRGHYRKPPPGTYISMSPCGGNLPPCRVKARESGGNYRVFNGNCYGAPCRGHSSASGAWQFVKGTWGRFGGYTHAAHAPPHVQDRKAALLWNGGRGCGHWNACRGR